MKFKTVYLLSKQKGCLQLGLSGRLANARMHAAWSFRPTCKRKEWYLKIEKAKKHKLQN